MEPSLSRIMNEPLEILAGLRDFTVGHPQVTRVYMG